MSKIISQTFYENREPQWLVESPKEVQSYFDRRGCVRQIRTSGYRSNSNVHTPGTRDGSLPETRTSSYPSEHRPSVANHADRQAYVHYAVPATHRTHTDRPAFNTTVSNIPVVEFMVPLCCGKCEEKMREELENVKGVYKVVCDIHNQRMAVSSTVDPQRLLKRIRRVKKNSQFWSGNSSHHVPSDHSHHSPVVHRSDAPHVYKPEPAHHRSATQMSGHHQRYHVPSPRLSYDPVETQYVKRKSLGPHAEDPGEFYYAGAEHQFRSSGYATGTPYVVNIDSSLRYDHHPSSYGPEYEYSEDYALSPSELYY